MTVIFKTESQAAEAFALIIYGRFNINLRPFDKGLEIIGEELELSQFTAMISHLLPKISNKERKCTNLCLCVGCEKKQLYVAGRRIGGADFFYGVIKEEGWADKFKDD